VARATARVCAYRFDENTGDEFICATRAGHGNAEPVLPVEVAPGVASTEKQLEFLISRGEFRLGEVYETVEGEFDLVTEFVGAPYDSIQESTNLHERGDEPFA